MIPTAKGLLALLCGAATAALLASCKPGAQEASAQDAPPPLAALPLTSDAVPQSQPGPVAVDLPYARPARIGPTLDPDEGYAYLDRAYFLNDAFGEAPPDYAFDYDDETPWLWRTDDGFIRVAEVLPYGDRYYYFQPDDDDPFLIRDPDYAYAYADGDLVAIYDSGGALLPPEDLMLHAPIAGRELARARNLFRRVGVRQQVPLGAWTQRRGQVASDVARWKEQEGQQTGWRRYHEDHLKQEQAHWAPERFRREAEAARLLQQVHDPDGAQHAWREARQAQKAANKAHVRIPLVPHGRPVGTAQAQTRVAQGPAPGLRMAMNPQGPGRGSAGPAVVAAHDPGPLSLKSAFGRARPDRFAMAQRGPEPRAQYNVRRQGRSFEARAAPRMRVAEQAHTSGQDRSRPQAHAFHLRGGPEPQHIHVNMPQRSAAPHFGGGGGGGGGGGPNFAGGGHPGGGGGGHGGGGHGGPPQQNGHGRGH